VPVCILASFIHNVEHTEPKEQPEERYIKGMTSMPRALVSCMCIPSAILPPFIKARKNAFLNTCCHILNKGGVDPFNVRKKFIRSFFRIHQVKKRAEVAWYPVFHVSET